MILTREVQAVKESVHSVTQKTVWIDIYIWAVLKNFPCKVNYIFPYLTFPPLYEKLMRHFWHMDNFQLDTFKEIFSFYSNQKVPLLIHKSPLPFSSDNILLPPHHTLWH